MKKIVFSFFLIIQIAIPGISALAQNKQPINEKDLEKYTYYFDITENRFVGDGAKFLTAEINKNQYILIGEYHGSLRISEFTKALIPVFHNTGCRNFSLEIGPVSSQILAEFSRDSSKVIRNLNAFNSKYYISERRRNFTPIPFFDNVEDAEFLAEAAKRKWNLIGLDQEFSFSYLPLIDRMYENLNSERKQELKTLYNQVINSIKVFYEEDAKDGENQFISISESAEVNKFLILASEKNPENKAIADALNITTGIYKNNANSIRKYYEANSVRIEYMKKNLGAGFSKVKFDWRKDKFLLKMGAVHTGRGFSPLSLFEIGNTLSELAEFHGNSSLHINFGTRFYVENEKEIDALDDKNGFLYRFQPLLQMAKKDQWTIIDLRPLREQVFYHRKFTMDDIVLDIFKNHDFFIIPKLEKAPTPNFVKR